MKDENDQTRQKRSEKKPGLEKNLEKAWRLGDLENKHSKPADPSEEMVVPKRAKTKTDKPGKKDGKMLEGASKARKLETEPSSKASTAGTVVPQRAKNEKDSEPIALVSEGTRIKVATLSPFFDRGLREDLIWL